MKVFFVVFMFCVAASAQVGGTVVVFEMTEDGFFIAADSRATYQGRLSEDNHCKIAAMDNHSVVAVTGVASYPSTLKDFAPGWDAIKEAKRAASEVGKPGLNTHDKVGAIADKWTENMESDLKLLQVIHPEKIREAAIRGKGTLSTGIFAVGGGGDISVAVHAIKIKDGLIFPEIIPVGDLCKLNSPCASGEVDIFFEFTKRLTKRSRKEELPTSPLSKVTRLVALTIAYDENGTVGGPVDALKLTPDGNIVWFGQKAECPEQHR